MSTPPTTTPIAATTSPTTTSPTATTPTTRSTADVAASDFVNDDVGRARARRSLSGLGRRIDAFIVCVAISSIVATTLVATLEVRQGIEIDSPVLFAIVALALVVTEVRSTPLLKHALSSVTPSWAFTFTLMLLGSPTGALVVSASATVLADVLARKSAVKVVFNVTQIELSLAFGALALFAFGVHGPVFDAGGLSSRTALAIIVAGVVVFSTNGIIVCRLLAWIEEVPFRSMMRDTFLLSMTADAAMLAIAPIFLITAENNLLLLPLMGTATFFVYQTAQDALVRAYEASHDSLTQLLNRRAFNEAIGRHLGTPDDHATAPGNESVTAGSPPDADRDQVDGSSVFILDLDRFKEINDRLGHRTGDLVLKEFASRLVDSLPPDASTARLGGDEFAVLLDATPAQAMEVAGRLRDQLAEPLLVDGFPLSAGSSIGVAHAGRHGTTPAELLHAADVAMYRAKRNRSGVEEYEMLGRSCDRGRVTLLADVVQGIDHDEFVLHYQPQVDLTTGRFVGAEALLRWDHPVHGRVMPDQFIALAEHTDLIDSITAFVVDCAVRDLADLDAAGHGAMSIAVNVSARNLEDRTFVRGVIETLAQHGVGPHRLEVEITEAALATDPEHLAIALDELRSHGLTVAIDDFGTGYSSFSTLRHHTVDRIKLDRSFVSELTENDADVMIVKSLIELSHALGLEVVAEGVQNDVVADILREHRCDQAQGFAFSRPVPIADFRRLLDETVAAEGHRGTAHTDSGVTESGELMSA